MWRVARHHPELRVAGKVWLIEASEIPYKWYLRSEQLGPNRWRSVTLTHWIRKRRRRMNPCRADRLSVVERLAEQDFTPV